MLAPHHAHDAWNDRKTAGAVWRLARVIAVDTVERGRETVGIAFAPLLTVGNDVEPGALLLVDCDQRRVILRGFELVGGNAPQLARPHPRRHLLAETRA